MAQVQSGVRAGRLRAVLGAIRLARERRSTAEEKVGGRGIAERPAADPAVEVEKRAALRQRDVGTGIGIIEVRLGIADPSRHFLPRQGKEKGPEVSEIGWHHGSGGRVVEVVPVHHTCGLRRTRWRSGHTGPFP
jgi:hypothetical protein